jgi:hypothetical protein
MKKEQLAKALFLQRRMEEMQEAFEMLGRKGILEIKLQFDGFSYTLHRLSSVDSLNVTDAMVAAGIERSKWLRDRAEEQLEKL